MALILIHGHVLNRRPSTLTLLRNRIRAGILNAQIFTETFQSLKVVVLVNHKEVLEISSSLLKSFEQSVSDFAKSMFIELFGIGDPFLRIDIVGEPSPISQIFIKFFLLGQRAGRTFDDWFFRSCFKFHLTSE